MRPIALLLWLLVLNAWLSASYLHAAFVLDDFDDPAMVVSPEMEGNLIQTLNVGDLKALRSLNISGRRASLPVATVDVSHSFPSRYIGTMVSVMLPPSDLGSGEFGLSYSTAKPNDYTEGLRNSALYIDVSRIDGPTPPPWLYALVRDNNDSFETFFPLNDFSSPGAIELRFDQFRPRGGGNRTTDFRSVTNLTVIVFGPGLFDSVVDQGWTIELDRIRVGQVPEPSCLFLGCLSPAFVLTRVFRVCLFN